MQPQDCSPFPHPDPCNFPISHFSCWQQSATTTQRRARKLRARMPAHLKRKRPPGGLESQPSFPVTATAPGPTVPRRATRQSSVPPLPVASDPEPRRRRPRRRADDTDGVPAESSPTIYSPRGKENIPMNSEQQHRQHLPAPSQVLKLTRLTRHSAGHDTGSAPRPSNTNVERAKPSHAVPRDLQVAPTSPAGTQRSLPPRATGTPAGSGRQPPVHHQQSVPVGRNKPIFMTTSVAQHKQLPTAAATTNGTPERAGRGTSTTGRTDRNIDKVVLGNIFFRAWYPSYYGKEVLGDISSNSQSAKGGKGGKPGGTTGAQYHEDDTNGGKAHGRRDRDHPPPMLDRLYVCPCCFKYSKELVTWWEHVRACERRGFVPGEKIYVHPKGRRTVLVPSGPAPKQGRGKRGSTAGQKMVEEVVQDEGEWSVWEVDGETDVVSGLLHGAPENSQLTPPSSFARTSPSSPSSFSTTNLSSSTSPASSTTSSFTPRLPRRPIPTPILSRSYNHAAK